MGNICKKCFIFQGKNKYIRQDLSQSRDLSIEFENLMTNDYFDELSDPSKKGRSGAPFTVASYMKWLSDQEKMFLDDDDDDEGHPTNVTYPLNNTPSTSFAMPNKVKKEKPINSNYKRNWCTFEDKNETGNESQLTNDQLTGYFLDELSRDITLSCDLVDPNNPGLYEEEIDGPELARLIRRMRPRDLFLTAENGDILAPAHSTILIGKTTNLSENDTAFTNLYNKIHDNLMKGIRNIHSVTTSERDQSSIDLDWDHEPGMNPSLALVHKRTDTEEDLIKRLNSQELKDMDTSTLKSKNDSNKNSQIDSIDQNQREVINRPLSIKSTANNEENSPSKISPTDCTDEFAWDMEEDLYTGNFNHLSEYEVSYPLYLPNGCCSSDSVFNDKRHLLSDK